MSFFLDLTFWGARDAFASSDEMGTVVWMLREGVMLGKVFGEIVRIMHF